MPPLNQATLSQNQINREEMAVRKEREMRRIEALLQIRSLPDTRRAELQVELLRLARTAHFLRTPVAPPAPGARMKSFVGLDPYEYNG